MPQTIERLRISITGVDYALAPLEHVDHLKGVIVEAVRLGGGFVDLTLDDGQRLSVLVTRTTHIVIAAQTVPLHALSADSDPQLGCLPIDPAAHEDNWPYDLI